MNCPYLDCGGALETGGQSCPECRRIIKTCQNAGCGASNRFWARYCTACGEPLAEVSFNWPCARGGCQRTGRAPCLKETDIHNWKLSPLSEIAPPAKGQAGVQWPSLLIYGDCLVTGYAAGCIRIFDLSARSGAAAPEVNSIELGEHLYSSPAISRESLYVGAGNSIFAYSMSMLLEGKSSQPRWKKSLDRAAVHSIMPVGDVLAVTSKSPDGLWEVGALKGVSGNRPPDYLPIHKAATVSSLAGNSLYAQGVAGESKFYFFFFSSNGRDTLVHKVDVNPVDCSLTMGSHTFNINLPVKDPSLMPVAAVGNIVYVLAGDGALFRFNAVQRTGQRMGNFGGLRDFALLSPNTPIVAADNAVFRLDGANRIRLEGPCENITAPPVLMGDKALILGLGQGEIRLYHPERLSHEKTLQVEYGRSVVSVAVSRNIVAAVSDSGLAKVWLVL
ncbi:MAG: hypothetical protein HZB23_09235 [Deltaproteobacteria bacterium]|nr:hypothetical protein [Deltaproteobacteria bacterium]